MSADQALLAAVRSGLSAAGDPAKAAGMQAYMKSAMPFHGVQAPAARAIFRAAILAHPLPDRVAWEDTVRALWFEATRREERYGALALAGHRHYRAYQDPDAMSLYRELVVTGAWWDLVDDLASRKVGPVLRAYPAQVAPVVRAWACDRDRWLRRTAILSQLGAKAGTDVALLTACLQANLDERDFFLRKAVGWALRDYARTAPDWVRAFVARHEDRLSPLSRREATKHL